MSTRKLEPLSITLLALTLFGCCTSCSTSRSTTLVVRSDDRRDIDEALEAERRSVVEKVAKTGRVVVRQITSRVSGKRFRVRGAPTYDKNHVNLSIARFDLRSQAWVVIEEEAVPTP